MSQEHPERIPTEINLHRKSHILSIKFADGKQFELPCEYLRVFSRAAEVRTMEHALTGKETVNIDRIEPQGQYAVRLIFDDGHDTGIYSWETLYQLGLDLDKNWSQYLKRLAELGYERQAVPSEKKDRKIRVLYFAYLVQHLHKTQEEVTLPESVTDVKELLAWLRGRNRETAHLLDDKAVRVTVSRQFCEPFTKLEDADEVGIVPNSPIPPVPPKKH